MNGRRYVERGLTSRLFLPVAYVDPDPIRRLGGVVFVDEGDDRITAVDLGTGVASYGESKAEALELHEGEGEPVTDETLAEWGLDPDGVGEKSLPECTR